MQKRVIALTLVFALLLTSFGLMLGLNDVQGAKLYGGEGKVDNVIFMIPDGFSAAYATNYRWFKGDTPIWDDLLVGMVKTHSANSEVTDSAAAGTAFATGEKTNNGMISVSPDGKELETILEASKKAGKSTGLVATSTITHATPAVFASHVASRANEADIAPQMLERVDVLLGGGKKFFLPKSEGGEQAEKNLITEAKNNGYQFVETRGELQSVKGKKLLGLFAADGMAPELDRKRTEQPSLAEMTAKAIDVLDQNKKGFFLMVEGSQIDWAGHAHDAAWAMKDTEAFEDAVKEAIDYAKKDGRTLVVTVGDHDTGGMSVGGYGEYAAKLHVLREVSATGNYMATQLDKERSNVKEVVKKYANIELTDEEIERIQSAKNPANAINDLISQRALVGWSSSAHTGVDVQLYAFGPQSTMFSGLIDNTDIPKLMAKAMNIEFGHIGKPDRPSLTRISGKDRYTTSIALSDHVPDHTLDTVILASGRDFPDALAGGTLVKALNGTVLLIDPNSKQLNDHLVQTIQRVLKSNGRILLLGGERAISKRVEQQLNKAFKDTLTVERLYGKNRQETAIAIAERVNKHPEHVFFVSGNDFADALSIIPYANKSSSPILLNASERGLDNAVKTYLNELKVSKATVIGGTAAVSDAVIEQLEKLGVKTERVSGKNRFLTALEVARKYYPNTDRIAIVNGSNFSDALSASRITYDMDMPVLLSSSGQLHPQVQQYIEQSDVKEVILVGGTEALDDRILDFLDDK